MTVNFIKMHGAGNDYIYIDCFNGEPQNPSQLALIMSPRHFSIGADGVVLICPSNIADAKMRMFNADGSEGKMCGNAIRCVGKYLYDNGITAKKEISVETLSGIKYLKLSTENDRVVRVTVDMGTASLVPVEIPVLTTDDLFISQPVTVLSKEYNITAVSMGNPHAVIYTDDVKSLDLEKIGPDFENMPIFPERVNTEFIRVISPTELEMRVWERGSGETWACGTGACASVVSSVVNGICPPDTDITVHLRGGDLVISCSSDYHVYMTGPAETSYKGVFEYED